MLYLTTICFGGSYWIGKYFTSFSIGVITEIVILSLISGVIKEEFSESSEC
jgi:hypothetical protein